MEDVDFRRSEVRQSGLKKVMVGGFGALVLGAVFYWVTRSEAPGALQKLALAITLPAVIWLLAGLTELTTGVPVAVWAKRWDRLQGWQRGVIGIFLVLAVLLIFAAIAAWYFSTQF